MTLADGQSAELIIELHDEQVEISRRNVMGQTVRIATTTQSREEAIEVPLAHERVEVERVAIGRVVETAPAIREEGEFTIFPVMEEVVVIERRLVLKEEVRVRRVRSTEVHRETVHLREQIANVTRNPLQPADLRADGVTPTIQQSSEKETS